MIIGLSAVTKLAPKRMTGLTMGAWFLSIAAAHKIAAAIAGLTGGAGGNGGEDLPPTESLPIYADVFEQITVYSIVAGFILILLGPICLKRWLHGVK